MKQYVDHIYHVKNYGVNGQVDFAETETRKVLRMLTSALVYSRPYL